MGITYYGGIPSLDLQLVEAASLMRHGFLGDALRLLSEVGYLPWFALLVVVFAAGMAVRARRLAAGVIVVVAALIANASFVILKRIFERPRPEFTDHVVSGWSMPSGHSTMAAALALVILFVGGFRHKIFAYFFAASYVLLTMLSRVVLGAHYPSDVLAGALLGSGCACLVFAASHAFSSQGR